ncbi:Sentrin-specific protease, partial [Zostera marina]
MANADGIPFYDLSSPEREGGSVQTRSMVLSKKISRESREAEKIAEKSLYSLTLFKRAKRGVNGRCTDSEKQKMLDTDKFECYLEKLLSEIPDEKKCSCVCLDSMWFSIYVDASIKKDQSQKAKVIKWVNKKQIFQRKYVFVPIVCWKHWNLLILCHFDEISKVDKPCMLLLDSLGTMGPERLEPDIR